MFTHFLAFELDWLPPAQLQDAILAELSQYGEPLRWAVVEASRCEKVQIEAVVTTTEPNLPFVAAA